MDPVVRIFLLDEIPKHTAGKSGNINHGRGKPIGIRFRGMRVMRWLRHFVICILIILPVSAVQAGDTPDPLRLVPAEADLLLRIDSPSKLLDTLTHHDLILEFLKLDAVREAYDNTNFRRFYQFVAYYEKQLGASHPELLDRLAGGGVVIASKLGMDPAPALLIMQAKDEALLKKFFKLSTELLQQELTRENPAAKLEKGNAGGVEVYHLGKDLYFAVAGSALLVSNHEKTMEKGIELHLHGDKNSLLKNRSVADARKLLEPNPLVWLWLNMDTVHKAPQAKEVFTLPRNDVNLTVLFGGLLDVAQRSSFLSAGLHQKENGFVASVRMPAGKDGMPAALAVHVPLSSQVGSRPLLEPKGVLYSNSFYLDLSQFWEKRDKLFNANQVKQFEEADKTTRPFLPGTSLTKLFAMTGQYFRFVAAHQPNFGYSVQLGKNGKGPVVQNVPAFGLVIELRESETFAKRMEAILRSAAFLAGTLYKIKSTEEQHGSYKIIGYRFVPDPKNKIDIDDYRFNFSPCFVTVGNQFLACSTIELGREMVDLLDKEAKEKPAGSPAANRSQFYSSGAVQLLEANKDRLFTQTMLDQAAAPAKANEQVRKVLELLARLGVGKIEETYGPRDFRLEIGLNFTAPKTASAKSVNQNGGSKQE